MKIELEKHESSIFKLLRRENSMLDQGLHQILPAMNIGMSLTIEGQRGQLQVKAIHP